MSTTTTPSRNDTAALWLAMLFGAGAAGVTVFQAVTRVIEIAPNRDVPTMGTDRAAAVLSASTDPANTAFVIEPVVLFAIASMGVLTAAFQIGHKLQRDAEGLV